MRYVLTRVSIDNKIEIDITRDDFEQIRSASNVLANALTIEEHYEILISIYLDLERELLNISIETLIKMPTGCNDFFEPRLECNKRIINLLTASRLYLYTLDTLAKEISNYDPDINCRVKKLKSREYDENFEYRFMEALRNHVQHRGLAVHSM